MYGLNAVGTTDGRVAGPRYRRGGFSLVELLTVIFIIALLISILIPALGKARDQAKKVVTSKAIESIEVGMKMFEQENGKDFAQTNGYPPSFVHPPLTGFGGGNFTVEEAFAGKFPYMEEEPVIYGAQWLPAMLMGADSQGYIKRSSPPKSMQPSDWYKPEAVLGKPIDRSPLYVTTENAPTRKTSQLAGRQPDDAALFPDWEKMKNMPVFVDGWDQPILYYAANTSGRATNMVEKIRNRENSYDTGEQGKGPPFYFHQDNEGFTGNRIIDDENRTTNGWNFGNGAQHTIAVPGEELTADLLSDGERDHKETFAHYVVDRKVYSNLLTLVEEQKPVDPKTPLRPVNADSYLLISPGVDGRFGTNDDVSNLPPFDQE